MTVSTRLIVSEGPFQGLPLQKTSITEDIGVWFLHPNPNNPSKKVSVIEVGKERFNPLYFFHIHSGERYFIINNQYLTRAIGFSSDASLQARSIRRILTAQNSGFESHLYQEEIAYWIHRFIVQQQCLEWKMKPYGITLCRSEDIITVSHRKETYQRKKLGEGTFGTVYTSLAIQQRGNDYIPEQICIKKQHSVKWLIRRNKPIPSHAARKCSRSIDYEYHVRQKITTALNGRPLPGLVDFKFYAEFNGKKRIGMKQYSGDLFLYEEKLAKEERLNLYRTLIKTLIDLREIHYFQLDLKSDNILVDSSPEKGLTFHLSDLGMLCYAEDEVLTEETLSQIAGLPGKDLRPPEMGEFTKQDSKKKDLPPISLSKIAVWQLGICICDMEIHDKTIKEEINAALATPPPNPGAVINAHENILKNLHPNLRALVLEMFKQDPAERISFTEIRDAFESMCDVY